MKKQLFTKMLLVALSLIGGSSFAWAQVSTWTYSTTLANNTIGSTFNGSTNGIVSVQLGADGDGANWQVLKSNNNNRGLAHNTNSVTKTDNIPTAGTFVKVTAIKKTKFVLGFYRAGSGYFRLIDAAAPATNILNNRHGGSGGNKTETCELSAGHTYYIYYNEDKSGEGNFSIQNFTATSYEDYTIHYVDDSATPVTIKSDVVYNGLYGSQVTASANDMAQITFENNSYAYSTGNETITLGTGTNEITLVYSNVSSANYTIKYVDGEGNAIADDVVLESYVNAEVTASGENLPTYIKKNGRRGKSPWISPHAT